MRGVCQIEQIVERFRKYLGNFRIFGIGDFYDRAQDSQIFAAPAHAGGFKTPQDGNAPLASILS